MKKRALRLLLGAGYAIFLTFLFLYQAGALGEKREWWVAALTTLFLGVALAVVLALYLRVSDQIRQQEQNGDSPAGTVRAAGGEQAGAEQETVKKHVSHIYQKMDVQSRKEFRARVHIMAAPVLSQTDLRG